jgi:hypothetical protein
MPNKAAEKTPEGLQQTADVVQGVVPASRIHVNGFTYVSLDYHEEHVRKAEMGAIDRCTNYLAVRGRIQVAECLKRMKSEIAPDGKSRPQAEARSLSVQERQRKEGHVE